MSARRMRRPALVALTGAALALVAVPGGSAGAQGVRPRAVAGAPLASPAADPRLAAFDGRTRAVLDALFSDAAGRGLPVEPLVAKALEGVEKGAPPVRVEGAVRALALRLDAARAALAPALSQAEVVAGADALAVGVPPDVLRGLRAASPRRSTAVALGVLAQLVSRGVPPARAAATVTELLRRGAASAQFLALDDAVQLDVASGVAPATALDVRAGALVGALGGTATTLDGAVSAPASGGIGAVSGGKGNTPRPARPRP